MQTWVYGHLQKWTLDFLISSLFIFSAEVYSHHVNCCKINFLDFKLFQFSVWWYFLLYVIVFFSTKSVCLNFIFIYFFNTFVKRRQLCCHISDLGCDRKDVRGNKENVGNWKEGNFLKDKCGETGHCFNWISFSD